MDIELSKMTYDELNTAIKEVTSKQIAVMDTDKVLWFQCTDLRHILETEAKRRASEGGCKDIAQKLFKIIL